MKRFLPTIGVVALAGLLIMGAYLGFSKFVEDRQSAMEFKPRPTRTIIQNPANGQPVTRTYTAEDLEKARKEGTLPKEMRQPVNPPTPHTNVDQVQRSLRTIEEINRMNQMNQRIMDQNRRMQNQ